MLRQRIQEAYKVAMKAKDQTGVATLRLILAALKDRDIAARADGNTDGIPEDQILEMLRKMVRQRRDSIEMYEQGGRLELAEREAQEITIIEGFLPQQMDQAAVTAAVDAVIADLEAGSLKDMGRVMAALKERHAREMDMSQASGVVKQRLG